MTIKPYYSLFLITLPIVIFSCFGPPKTEATFQTKALPAAKELVKPEFQAILDSADVAGTILLYDVQEDLYYSNDFAWSKEGQLPASTFKIPNSIIALESGVVKNDSTLFKWDGEQRALQVWEQDLIFRDAFRFSCVPCYQEVARKIGAARMNEYLNKLDYGKMSVDSTTIHNFWLRGESRISPFQQIDFLKRLYRSELPIAARTQNILQSMMIIEQNDDYTLRGKTGWSNMDGENNGWFVGYIINGENVHFFATNIEPQERFDMDLFPQVRRDVTHRALRETGILK